MAAKKVVHCSFSDIDSTIKEMGSFGWDEVSTDFNKDKTKAKITFEKREMKLASKVKDLEHQYMQVQRTIYVGTIFWIVLAVVLILLYFLATSFQYRVIFLLTGIPAAGIALILFLNRTILLLNRRKYCRMIIHEADIASGNIREAPLVQNLAPSEQNSNLIRKNINKINKK